AFMEGEPFDENTSRIRVLSETENLTIKRAGFPLLLGDSNQIVYSSFVGKKENGVPKLELVLRNLENQYQKENSGIFHQLK
ncbi:MAG: hypothetical protein KGD73_13245, partial [Candidatus Lokiarchaeota archaeon]|nr:hypothetical protein [Candidatus Lokiarchaeota archaeon]